MHLLALISESLSQHSQKPEHNWKHGQQRDENDELAHFFLEGQVLGWLVQRASSDPCKALGADVGVVVDLGPALWAVPPGLGLFTKAAKIFWARSFVSTGHLRTVAWSSQRNKKAPATNDAGASVV